MPFAVSDWSSYIWVAIRDRFEAFNLSDPDLGAPKYHTDLRSLPFGNCPRNINSMSTVKPLIWPRTSRLQSGRSAFENLFESAPIPAALCNSEGEIIEQNAAFEGSLEMTNVGGAQLLEMVSPVSREATRASLRSLFQGDQEMIEIAVEASHRQTIPMILRAWRLPRRDGASERALILSVEHGVRINDCSDDLQSQRWEAIGRLTGGVVHDFNNLLTGVMLYCDLLLTAFDARDRRKRYADEIRSATLQATELVQQLLVFARPQQNASRPLCWNDIVENMRTLLARLIGENIELDLHLDPQVGVIEIARSQAQQVLLNLVLNARDALPKGGRITIETSNCNFQPLSATTSSFGSSALPCVLLVVSDNGRGMTAEVQRRLFEPFFTTKTSAKGGGLGLTTVRGIVTTNRGLIHIESEPGHGTRAMILFPTAPWSSKSIPAPQPGRVSISTSSIPLQEAVKDSHL